MTIKRPELNIFDRFLYVLGKKRGVILPRKAHEQYGPHVYATVTKESFWQALLRPKRKALPNGMADLLEWVNQGVGPH